MTSAWPAALLLLLLGSGCALAPPPPPDTFYRLEVAAPAVLPRPLLPGVVEVKRFDAEGLTGDRALLYSYRDRPDQVLRYSYHFWVDAPPTLFQDQLLRVLRQAGAVDTVVTSGIDLSPDYVIEGRLRRFEELAGASPAVVVEADIAVVRVRGDALLMLHSYRVEKPAASEQPADAVRAFQAAVGELAGRFLDDLSRMAAR